MRRRLTRLVPILVALNLAVVACLAALIAYSLVASPGGRPAPNQGDAAGSSASPGTSFGLMPMGNAHIPTSQQCVLCHGAGGEVKTVPAILHPVEGWRRCLVCHTDETLGRKAPGHEGIAEGECLNCHKNAQTGPAITQPHLALQDQHCLVCHGSVAHLPTTMASTKESDCVLCHKPATLAPPSYPHVADPRLTCRSCHQSAEVGALPIDHALRSDDMCLLCHQLLYQPGVSPLPLPSVPLPSPGTSLTP
jgi:hypothetical protein